MHTLVSVDDRKEREDAGDSANEHRGAVRGLPAQLVEHGDDDEVGDELHHRADLVVDEDVAHQAAHVQHQAVVDHNHDQPAYVIIIIIIIIIIIAATLVVVVVVVIVVVIIIIATTINV